MAAELENHLGISEKTLAEFVIDLAKGKASVKEFQKALTANHAEMPESLVHTIWSVIQRLTKVSWMWSLLSEADSSLNAAPLLLVLRF